MVAALQVAILTGDVSTRPQELEVASWRTCQEVACGEARWSGMEAALASCSAQDQSRTKSRRSTANHDYVRDALVVVAHLPEANGTN